MRKKFWPIYVVTLCTWSLLSYASLFEWLFQKTLLARVIDGRPYISDFVNVYNAGKLARRAMTEPISIYDPVLQDASARELIAPVAPERPFNLQYPPYFFVLNLPLCIFNISGAWVAWFVFYAATTWLVLRYLTAGMQNRLERNVAIALVFASYPAWLSFELGQTSLPEFLFFAAFLWSLQHARHWLSGVMAAFITVKLQYAPFIGIAGLIAGRIKFVAGGALMMLALLGVSALMLGPANVIGYPQSLLHGETGTDVSGVAANEMQTVRGSLCLLLGSDSQVVHLMALAAMIAACILIAFVWWRARRNVHQDFDLFRAVCSLTVLAALTTSLHTHVQDYLIVAIPCLWLWQLPEVRDNEKSWLRKLIVWFPGFSWICLIAKPVFMLIRIQPMFLWALAMLFLTVRVVMARLHTESRLAQS